MITDCSTIMYMQCKNIFPEDQEYYSSMILLQILHLHYISVGLSLTKQEVNDSLPPSNVWGKGRRFLEANMPNFVFASGILFKTTLVAVMLSCYYQGYLLSNE